MEVLVLVGAIQAAFLAVLVITKKGKSVSDKILAFWFFVFAAHLGYVYFSFKMGEQYYVEHAHYVVGAIVTYYSLMYVYAKSLSSKENKFNSRWLLHLIPIVITYLSVIPWSLYEYADKVNFITENDVTDYILTFPVAFVFIFTSMYLFGILRLLHNHRITIRKMFSYEEDINLGWLKILAIMLIFLWLALSVIIASIYYTGYISPDNSLEQYLKLDIYGTLPFVIFVFILGFYGIKQQVVYASPPLYKENIPSKNETEIVSRYKNSSLKKDESEIHLEQLIQYLETDKPYLNGKLSLKDVAAQLGLSTNHLSQVINENLNKNFFDLVNSYRIELVKQRLSEDAQRNFTVLAIAYECGFNSKSSFNAIFKKFTGLTPSQYMKNN